MVDIRIHIYTDMGERMLYTNSDRCFVVNANCRYCRGLFFTLSRYVIVATSSVDLPWNVTSQSTPGISQYVARSASTLVSSP